MNDHDLLIELRTKVDGISADIKSINIDTKARIVALETDKVGQHDFSMHLLEDSRSHNDHEKRIRSLERYIWVAMGIIAAIQFITIIIIKFVKI